MTAIDLRTGISAFNRGSFFEAHEILEDLWREVPRDQPRRRHLQGLVQLAVAFHHQSTTNNVGAQSVLRRALRNLVGAESSFPEIDLERLRSKLDVWVLHLDHCNHPKREELNADKLPSPVLPKITSLK